jgi:four helix bundle protein
MKLPSDVLSPETLKDRLERFARDVFALTAPMLKDPATRDVALQLRRACTGAFANYSAACVARSHADFTSKIGIAFEEADESRNWIRFLRNASLASDSDTKAVSAESLELRAILAASHLTAKRNRGRR